MREAEKLAKADLETKAKIKKAAQMAAEVQKKSAQSYKDKLEREAREWLKKKGQSYFKTTYSKAQILELINYNFRGTKLQIVEDQSQLIDIVQYNNWTPECEN